MHRILQEQFKSLCVIYRSMLHGIKHVQETDIHVHLMFVE